MAEGARLESVFTRKGNVGSNPTLSARFPGNDSQLKPEEEPIVSETNGDKARYARERKKKARQRKLNRELRKTLRIPKSA